MAIYNSLVGEYGGRSPAITSQASAADGAFRGQLYFVTKRCLVKKMEWTTGSAVQDNAYLAIYKVADSVNEDADLTGATLVYASPELTPSGTNSVQTHKLTTQVVLEPGRYYIGLLTEGTTLTYMRFGNQPNFTNAGMGFTRSGGFGAPPNPAPASTSQNAQTSVRVLVLEDIDN